MGYSCLHGISIWLKSSSSGVLQLGRLLVIRQRRLWTHHRHSTLPPSGSKSTLPGQLFEYQLNRSLASSLARSCRCAFSCWVCYNFTYHAIVTCTCCILYSSPQFHAYILCISPCPCPFVPTVVSRCSEETGQTHFRKRDQRFGSLWRWHSEASQTVPYHGQGVPRLATSYAAVG